MFYELEHREEMTLSKEGLQEKKRWNLFMPKPILATWLQTDEKVYVNDAMVDYIYF